MTIDLYEDGEVRLDPGRALPLVFAGTFFFRRLE
jgi:hypothetical protein